MLNTRAERAMSRQPHSSLWLPAESPSSERRHALLECVLLIGLLTVVGWFVVPSHWTSIWMDREFTGWVAPVANRLGDIRLYADGGHVPMPPLPFVFIRLVTAGHATWLCESAANFAFQALTLLAMYVGLRSLFRAPVPFLATAAAIPVFLSLPKTIVYDSMVQFFVALVGLGILAHARRVAWRGLACAAGIHSRWSDVFSLPLLGTAAAAAACLLTKQSTGGGVCLGAAAAMLLASAEPMRRRLHDVALLGAWTAVLGALMVLALSPWIDAGGLLRDVFLTGSEPKGGSLRLLKILCAFGLEIGQQALLMALVLIAGMGAMGRRRDDANEATPERGAGFQPATGKLETCSTTPERHVANLPPLLLLMPALAALLAFLVFPVIAPVERLSAACGTIARQMLWAGLLLGLWFALWRRGRDAATPLFVVLLGAALCHSLSTPRFRWTYDNNPLIVLAFALFLSVSLDLLGGLKLPEGSRTWATSAFVLAVSAFAWLQLGQQLLASRACTHEWNDVDHLAGARLPESAEGMHQTVAVVRELASPDDSVLLLPNDPNVEAWFDRPRPRLSAPIIFADQYWDRLVDGDLASLREQLPRVIVIGPRRFWRDFQWNWQPNYGAARLTDTVLRNLLPNHYRLQESVPIMHHGAADAMDVYVRNR